jgi:hypothetical protein
MKKLSFSGEKTPLKNKFCMQKSITGIPHVQGVQ